jgi:hypothetical protein
MRRAWIILLLVAMLPVHGWAAAAMGVRMAALDAASDATPIAATVAAMSEADTHCHGHTDGDHATGGLDATERAPHDCASCDLCHAGVAVLADDSVAPLPATPADVPAAHPRNTGRLMATCLERPPRA